MKIHEYQAKDILAKYGVPVPRGRGGQHAGRGDDRGQAPLCGWGDGVVVKAQIHAGGRGKGGGVKVAKNLRRGRAAREGYSRHAADHASDGAAGAEGAAAAD